MNKQSKALIPEGRPCKPSVFFYHELPQIASCKDCVVLVPYPNITQKEKIFTKWKRRDQTLVPCPRDACIVLLLEYNSDRKDLVNFAGFGSQNPAVTLDLNNIIRKTLQHKDLNVLQEFQLHDTGKKRSVVLQFNKGEEFDKFHLKLQEVIKVLESCRDGRSTIDKKYYLVGYRKGKEQDLIEDITQDNGGFSTSSSDETVNSVTVLSDYIPTSISNKTPETLFSERVCGLDRNRSQSEKRPKKRYDNEIFGSMQKPPPPSDFVNDDETIQNQKETVRHKDKSSNDTESTHIEYMVNAEGKQDNAYPFSFDATKSMNIKDIDPDHNFKDVAQLLQTAINDCDPENARHYAGKLAASHVKVAITVDENSLKEETNDHDIKIKVVIKDKQSAGESFFLSVKLTDTIGELKAKMFSKHQFPVEIQKWIVGSIVPNDDETLQTLRVTDGQTVFLYLVPGKSADGDKQQHWNTKSGYVDMTLVLENGVHRMMPTAQCNSQQSMTKLNSMPINPRGKMNESENYVFVDNLTTRI